MQDNFGANLLVEKEFEALEHKCERGKRHLQTCSRGDHLASVSPVKLTLIATKRENFNQMRRSKSPKSKTDREENTKPGSPARLLI